MQCDCICTYCANNVECINVKTNEVEFACFNCDECSIYTEKGTINNIKSVCNEFKQTEYKTLRIRKGFKIVR